MESFSVCHVWARPPTTTIIEWKIYLFVFWRTKTPLELPFFKRHKTSFSSSKFLSFLPPSTRFLFLSAGSRVTIHFLWDPFLHIDTVYGASCSFRILASPAWASAWRPLLSLFFSPSELLSPSIHLLEKQINSMLFSFSLLFLSVNEFFGSQGDLDKSCVVKINNPSSVWLTVWVSHSLTPFLRPCACFLMESAFTVRVNVAGFSSGLRW